MASWDSCWSPSATAPTPTPTKITPTGPHPCPSSPRGHVFLCCIPTPETVGPELTLRSHPHCVPGLQPAADPPPPAKGLHLLSPARLCSDWMSTLARGHRCGARTVERQAPEQSGSCRQPGAGLASRRAGVPGQDALQQRCRGVIGGGGRPGGVILQRTRCT